MNSEFADWKIFLLEEGSFVLVYFWHEESWVEGGMNRLPIFLLPYISYFIGLHQVATLLCIWLQMNCDRNERKRICWLDKQTVSTDYFLLLLARSVASSVILIDLRFKCNLVLIFYHPPKTYFIFMHFWVFLFNLDLSLIQTVRSHQVWNSKTTVTKLCIQILKTLTVCLTFFYVVNKVLYLKFCEDLLLFKPERVNHVRLSMFVISKVQPFCCSGVRR